MALQKFRKVHSSADELNEVQDNIKSALDPISGHILLGGNFFRAVPLTSGDNFFQHGLGRNFISWDWFNPNADVAIFRSTTPNPDPSKYVVIHCGGSVVADLYVF